MKPPEFSPELTTATNELSSAVYEVLAGDSRALSSFSGNSLFMKVAELKELRKFGERLLDGSPYKGLPERGPYFEFPNGGGFLVGPGQVGLNLVVKEWEAYALRGKNLPSVHDFSLGILDRVSKYALAARTGKTEAQQLTSIRGLDLVTDVASIELPTGTIYPNPQIVDFAADCVPSDCFFLSIEHPVQMRVTFGDAADGPEDRSMDYQFQVDLALARLALFTSANIRVHFGTRELRLPFGSHSRGALDSSVPDGRPSYPTTMNQDMAAATRAKSIEIRKAYHPSLAVAYVRLASALLDRQDPADILIDAVMVWECIFGAPNESVLRVTAAMAHLLEPDKIRRKVLWRRLKSIYNARSAIVHGAAGSLIGLRQLALEAATVAQDALRKLPEVGPDFLEMKSADRSAHLLLGM